LSGLEFPNGVDAELLHSRMRTTMFISSLSRKTDLIFTEFSGKVIDRGHYLLVQTPQNPGYHWGNYIVFDAPPQEEDYQKWTNIFRREFSYYDHINHMVFTWESDGKRNPNFEEFLDNGFVLERGVVLATNNVIIPARHRNELKIGRIETEHQWDSIVDLQILCRDPKFARADYERFKRVQFAQYKAMSERGMGSWFGAYLGDRLVGDCGVFHKDELARYQNVETHPDYRRQGVCQTLVYETALFALEHFNVTTLVMEADVEYHAAKAYESVGFRPVEHNLALSWWVGDDKKK